MPRACALTAWSKGDLEETAGPLIKSAKKMVAWDLACSCFLQVTARQVCHDDNPEKQVRESKIHTGCLGCSYSLMPMSLPGDVDTSHFGHHS